jgi:hypothetical protein
VAEAFEIAPATAQKYINMTDSEIDAMDSPANYKKRDSPMNKWLNIIFKMMDEGHSNESVYFYILHQPQFLECKKQLSDYIYVIGKNNFPKRVPFNPQHLTELVYPPEVTVIGRTALLKYLLTLNTKTKKDEEIGKHIDIIKERYPVAAEIEETFKEFHSIVMGTEPRGDE